MDVISLFWVIVAIVAITAFLKMLFSGRTRSNRRRGSSTFTETFFDGDSPGFGLFDSEDD